MKRTLPRSGNYKLLRFFFLFKTFIMGVVFVLRYLPKDKQNRTGKDIYTKLIRVLARQQLEDHELDGQDEVRNIDLE